MHTPLKSDKPSEPVPAPKAETVDQVQTKSFNRNKNNNNKYQQNSGSGGSSSHNGSPHRNNSNRHYQQNGSSNYYQSVHQLLQQSHSSQNYNRHQSNSRNWNRNRKANDGNNNNSNTTNNNSNTSNLSNNNNNNKNYNNSNNNKSNNSQQQSNPKLDLKNQKGSKLKSQKSQESLNQQPATVTNDPSPPHSESVSPTPSSSSTCFNVSSPTMNSSNSTNSEGSHKKSKYSSEFLNMVRHKMEHINNSQSSHKNGKNHQMQLTQMNKCKNEMDLAALRIALSGITQPDGYNYSYYNSHHVQMMHTQQNQQQKQQQQMYHHQSWTYPRSNYPMHHFEDQLSNGNHRNYQSFHRSYNNNNSNGNHREDLICTCSFQYRNSNTAIYCVHCRYPLKKPSHNHRRYKNNNQYQQNNNHHNNNNNFNGIMNNKNQNKHSNQMVYVNSEYYKSIPKSLSPTPTPSNSSKSESPTIENQQNSIINHNKETDLPLNVVDFENLDDEVSSEVSSTHTNQPTIVDHYTHSSMSTSSSSTASANQHPDIENYPRTPINNQQPIELVSDQNSLVANYGFWFNYPVPQSPFPPSPTVEQVHPYLSIQQYQSQTQNHKNQGPNQNNEESQNIMKRRLNGRVSPSVYPNSLPIQMSPNYHNLIRNGYRFPYLISHHEFLNVSPSDRFLARAHLVEVKEPPSDLLNNSKWDRLSQSIWERFKNRQQTEETYRKKMNLWRILYFIMRDRFLERSHPNNGLYLVGSTISGFGADTSDIDMCLVARNSMSVDPRTESLVKLGEIKTFIMNSNYFEEFLLIQARVPILRFRDVVNKVEVDLNFNNCVGVRNTHLLYCYSQMDWRLRPLALIVKSWTQHHNINDARNMTISSYSLVLMVIHFLQCAVYPPVLPCLHKVYPDKFQAYQDICNIDMVEELEQINSENRQTLGELFVDFLEYFSHFDFARNAISIRLGSVMPIDECRAVKSYKNDPNHWKTLCIEEPFDLTNTARSVYDEEIFERIKDVFYYSWCKVRETLSLDSVFGEPLFKPQPITNGYQMSYEKSDNGAQSLIRDIKSIS